MGVIGIIFGSIASAAGFCSTGSKTHETNKRKMEQQRIKGPFLQLFSVCCFLSPNVASMCSSSTSEGHQER